MVFEGGLTFDEDTNIAGITGDPDTSIAEYGGLLGYAMADTSDDAEPYFNSPEDQASGDTIVFGGLNQEAGETFSVEDVPGAPNIPWRALIAVIIIGAGLWLLGPVINLADTLAGG